MSRDTQRSRVYAAELFVRTLFDRAAEHNLRAVDFFGASITLPPEARFASVESVQRYVDEVLQMPVVTARWPTAGPVTLRARRAATAAHYEAGTDGGGVIAVPERTGSGWALRELVVFFGHFTAVYTDSNQVLPAANSMAERGVAVEVAGFAVAAPTWHTGCNTLWNQA